MESLAVTFIGIVWFVLWIAYSIFAMQFAFRTTEANSKKLEGHQKWLFWYGVGFSYFLVGVVALSFAILLALLLNNAIRQVY